VTQTYPGHTPSGLFPSGPPRPTYREPHPVRGRAVAAGLGAGALWLLLIGLLAESVRSYAWWSVISVGVAWLVALVLVKRGDRGVAAGIAISAGVALALATIVVGVMWAAVGWPMW
jgi:hypothetical protein